MGDIGGIRLRHLLGDAVESDFFSQIYEQRHLHVRRPKEQFSDLISLKVIEDLLALNERSLGEFVRYHHDGRDVVPPSNVGSLDMARWIVSEYTSGTTIVLNALEDRHLPIARFVRGLELELGFRVSAAAYATPTGARAFPVHFDTHDVIIAQVEGSKTYEVCFSPSVPSLPMRRQQSEISAIDLPDTKTTITLAAGEVLYIPRGMAHVAWASETHSLHITFSLHPCKVADLASTVIELAAEIDPALRATSTRRNRDRQADIVASLSSALGVAVSLEDVVLRQRERFLAGLRALPGHRLSDADRIGSLSLGTWLEQIEGSEFSLRLVGDDLAVVFAGLEVVRDGIRAPTRLGMPSALKATMEFIARQTAPFQLTDMPVEMTSESRLVLGRFLIREGLLQMV